MIPRPCARSVHLGGYCIPPWCVSPLADLPMQGTSWDMSNVSPDAALELTRFGGHPESRERPMGVTDAEKPSRAPA
jgi:hypothetical protein